MFPRAGQADREAPPTVVSLDQMPMPEKALTVTNTSLAIPPMMDGSI